MKPSRALQAVGIVVGVVLSGCGGDDPPLPVPGSITVSFATPNTSDGAVLFTVLGPGMTNLAATNSSNQLFSRLVAPRELRVIVVGNLSTGPLFTMDVPNTNDISGFSASVEQVADRNDDLRADLTGYSVQFPAVSGRQSGLTGPGR